MDYFPYRKFTYESFEAEILLPKVEITIHAFFLKSAVILRASIIRSVFVINLNFFAMASLMRSATLLFRIFCKEKSNVNLIPPHQTSPISDLFEREAINFNFFFSCLYL